MASRWSSQFGFIMATVGTGVGLGNIWKFPYMAGEHGGGAFMLLYIGLVFLVGLPALLAEMIIGRHTRRNQVDAMQKIAIECGKTPAWRLLGWWGALALIMILSFYSVVSGWSIGYLWRTLTGEIMGLSPSAIATVWEHFMQDPWELLGWHTLFMLFTTGIVMGGVSRGIEKASKIMMPLLFFILIVLVIYGLQTSGFMQAVDFLFVPDWSEVNGDVILAALGQAFFSLSLGTGTILVYASYTKEETEIAKPAMIITVINTFIAMLAGLAIFPVVFTHGLPPTGGPNLMYNTLPVIFSQLDYGNLLGGAFFLLLFFAALTSSISMLEPLVTLTIERTPATRKLAALLFGTLAWALGIVTVLSFNLWSGVRVFDKWSIFQVMTDLPTNVIMPTSGLFFAIFVGWMMPKALANRVLNLASQGLFQLWHWLIRWVVPIAITAIFVHFLI